MKITRHNWRVQISCTEAEFDILCLAIDQLELAPPEDTYVMLGERRLRAAWSQRTRDGCFMRVDKDKTS